jgi:predicted lipid-binding transport protein (Tim44 family)
VKKFISLMGAMALVSTQSYAAHAQGEPNSPPETHKCNAGKAAVAGALIGGLLGGFAARNNGRGALLGAAIGAGVGSIACVVVNSRVVKTRTNAQVAQDHASDIGAADTPRLFSYTSSPDRPQFSASQPIVIRDSMDMFIPANYQGQPVSEVWTITEPGGESKTLPAKVVDGSNGQAGGQMTNEITFNLPNGMRHGVYQVASQLMMGGKVMGTAQTSFVVV